MPTQRILPFLLLSMTAAAAQAQIDRTEINGTVTDTSGAQVPNVSVSVVQEGTGIVRQATTNSHGQFVVSSLPTGCFAMLLHAHGFQDVRIADIELHSGDTRTLNRQLAAAAVNETVTVEADKAGAQLKKSDATFGGTIQSVQIRELPLNGRNIATLELLAPGAIETGTGQQNTIRFSGQSIDDTNYRLDGVDASGVLRQALKSGLRLQFSTEAVSAFKVDAGAYTADTGGSVGGQVNLVSKSGTNELHGSVFDYLRNSWFDVQSPIKSAAHPQFHLNQFGGSMGGPIVPWARRARSAPACRISRSKNCISSALRCSTRRSSGSTATRMCNRRTQATRSTRSSAASASFMRPI